MSWYTILFIACILTIVVKAVLSWIVGDVDVDVDVDGDVDTDLGSVFSFKGILHFLTGFSTYLTMCSRYITHGNMTFVDYSIAFLVGIGLMFLLYWVYKLMKKLDNVPDQIDDFEGHIGTIYNNLGNGSYVVSVNTFNGTHFPTGVYNPETPEEADSLIEGTSVCLGKIRQDGSYEIIIK